MTSGRVRVRKRYRPNWPLRWFLLACLAILVGTTWIATFLTVGPATGTRFDQFAWNTALLNRLFEVFFGFWFFFFGACVGSFLNVIAWRMPRGISINGFSRCPYCQVGIRGEDNIPLLGWIRLRGRCRTCRLPISFRYPFFEALAGFVFLFVYLFQVLTHGGNLPMIPGALLRYDRVFGDVEWDIVIRTLVHLWLLTFLLAGGLIRFDRQRIPINLISFVAVVWCVAHVVFPDLIVVTWNGQLKFEGPARPSQALVWLSCGALAGLTLGAMSHAALTGGARAGAAAEVSSWDRRSTWCMFLLAGLGFGWQGAVSILLILVAVLGVVWFVSKALTLNANVAELIARKCLVDPAAWIWLAAVIHLLTWSAQSGVPYWPHVRAAEYQYAIATLLGIAGMWLIGFGSVAGSRRSVEPIASEHAQNV